MSTRRVMRSKYGYLWVTLIFFLVSIVGHWAFAWYRYADEQREHGRAPEVSGYLVEVAEGTLENWQSEFLQLMWQVAGLALLFYVGSPQSKEGDERHEEKLDWIIRRLDAEHAETMLAELDAKYPRK